MRVVVNPDIFNSKYFDAFDRFKRFNYIYGGSSSAKSYSLTQYAVIRALAGEAVLFVRATKASIRASNFADIKHIVREMGLEGHFQINETGMHFKSKVSVGCIQLVGADKQAAAAKGIKPNNGQGAFTILIFDEADQVSREATIQLNLRMRGTVVGGFSKRTFYVFNPVFYMHWLFQEEILKTGFNPYRDWELSTPDTLIMRCTYKDNAYLAQDEIDYLENLGSKSSYYKQVYLDAEPGILGDRVFENINTIKRSEVPKGLEAFAGLDFGWQDPTAFTLMKVDHSTRNIYIVGGFSKQKMDHLSISARVKKVFNENGCTNGVIIYGDSEDPRLIKQIAGQQLSIKGAKKPPGSVLSGIVIINTYIINICDDLKDHVDAFQNYTWKKDANSGNSIDEPDHTWSHIPDSARYGLEKLLRGNTSASFGKASN